MVDSNIRQIEYLRISLTDKCNLNCCYCMPSSAESCYKEGDLLTTEEVVKAVKASAKLGIRKVRLTGGEPLIRPDIETLIGRISCIEGIEDVSITTNGVFLKDQVAALAQAGLKRINISLDTLKDQVYKEVTGKDLLQQVIEGIHKAIELGLELKLNVVPIVGINDGELVDLALLARDWGLDVRFIELMPIGKGKNYVGIPTDQIIDTLRTSGLELEALKAYKGRGPAKYYGLKNAKGAIGFISPMSHGFCGECNRIRLTSEGFLKLCLHSSKGIQLKPYLLESVSEETLIEALSEAVLAKPKAHKFNEDDDQEDQRMMYQIGG